MYDVFISHSSKDKESYVYELRDCLTKLGCDTWLDESQILTGDNILHEIKKGIEGSVCVALILTHHFFESNWASLEIGLALSNPSVQVIPIIIEPPESFANKFPFLLTRKYLKLNKNMIEDCAKELSSDISKLKERQSKLNPLNYQKKVRELNNFDSPITNKLSILITEYEQICKISIDTGVSHAAKIARTIINDLYERSKQNDDLTTLSYENKLNLLLTRNSGINRGVYEHFKSLITITESFNDSFFNDENKKKMADMSLASILDWYLTFISLILRNSRSSEKIDIVWFDEFTYQDFVDMHEIDKLLIRSDLIAPPETTYNWYLHNNYSHIAVRSTTIGKIVGYFTLFPVTDELYEEIKSGCFKDNHLDTSSIRTYDIPDFYKLYVSCVCVHPNYKNTTAFHKLYHSLIKMMYDLATEKEIYITDIITEASTPDGLRLCKMVGLSKLMETDLDTEIYGTSMLPPSLRLNSIMGKNLIQFYQNKYNELKKLF